MLTNLCESQDAYLSERLIDVLRDGNECSQHWLGKRDPTRSCRVVRCPLFCSYLDNRSNEFDDLLFLHSEFIVP